MVLGGVIELHQHKNNCEGHYNKLTATHQCLETALITASEMHLQLELGQGEYHCDDFAGDGVLSPRTQYLYYKYHRHSYQKNIIPCKCKKPQNINSIYWSFYFLEQFH